jgi:threonine/homoserine/homoserine lactone efflux protein
MASGAPGRRGPPVRIGFTVGVTNPKTIVFFVAFLPQFTDASGHVALQTLLLGLVFAVLAVASDSVWALAAGKARDWFASRPTRLDALSATGGAMMVGLGTTMLVSE